VGLGLELFPASPPITSSIRELSLAKVAGVPILLLPTPQRLKEWAYAGFAINLGSAFTAHLATGQGASAPSVVAGARALSHPLGDEVIL
jgi:hypothetical protein